MLKKARKILSSLGPGIVTGASDDDPSGIATYSQTGAQFGYTTLWRAVVLIPFTYAVQFMCAKISYVTNKGLATNIKEHYPRLLYFAVFILIIANSVNIGADLGAMAAAIGLFVNTPTWVTILLVTILTITLEILMPYKKYAGFLKYLTLSLVAYLITAFLVTRQWDKVAFYTFTPNMEFTKAGIMNLVAVLGTTISPYLFFWQSGGVIEEVAHKTKAFCRHRVQKSELKLIKIDTFFGMLIANVIMYFIILTTASTLGQAGITNIETADQAAMALRPLAGDFSAIVFAIGIIGTGLLAIPILAGANAYAVSEVMGWKRSLNAKYKDAPRFYKVITVSIVAGALLNFLPIKPFELLYNTAILNGVVAPPLMFIIMLISNNKKIMGKHTNSKFINIAGGMATLIMGVAGIALIVLQFV